MGIKLAVVGGGSTYTPELVEGFTRRADRLPVDELVLLDIDPERLEIVGGLAERMLDRLGWPGRLVLTADPDAAHRRRRLRPHPAPGRRPGGTARRRDAAAAVRADRPGDDRRGRLREGAADRAGRARPRGADGEARRAGRLDRRLHEPGRDRDPGAARRRPPGDRAVQRRDRVPATVRRAIRRRAGAGRARARRAQPPDAGTGRSGSTASIACRSCSTTDGEELAEDMRHAGRAAAADARDPVLLPPLLLPVRHGPRRAARRPRTRARGGHRRSRRDLLEHVPRPEPRREAGAARATAAARSTARRRRS